MDAKDHPVISVLGDQRRFVVPIYQRQYQWGEARLKPFWEDVAAKAEESLSGPPRFSHYMGALILAPGGDGFKVGTTPRVQVVDGQQRLTTFQLFLAALREVSGNLGYEGLMPIINNYLYVPPMYGDTDPQARFRLVPTPEDRAVFQTILEGGLAGIKVKQPSWFFKNGNLISGAEPAVAVRALCFFIKRITTYARYGIIEDDPLSEAATDEPESAVKQRLHALVEALLNHLKLVVITLAENDDAQVIFETLNSQAQPLLAMDLVRNNIFHRASAQGESVEALFEAKWRPFDHDKAFWTADSPRAKPVRPRIDHFLSHALTAQTGKETSLRELYAEYRAFMRPKGQPRFTSVEAELDALIAYRAVYKTLETGSGDEGVAHLGAKLNLWEVSTAYPLVFCIAVAEIEASEKLSLYTLIYSYLVRRALCGLTPKNLNKIFAKLVEDMIQHGTSVATFAKSFVSQRAETSRFPSDSEFQAAIRTKPAYDLFRRKERLSDVLWDLECASRSKYAVHTPRPANMSVEHIMPQEWPACWPLPDGRAAPSDKKTGADEAMLSAISAREALLQTLGNLTLITVPGNTAASNKAFPAKRTWLQESLLALNVPLLQRATWDEAAITDRAGVLADLAVKVWPAPVSP